MIRFKSDKLPILDLNLERVVEQSREILDSDAPNWDRLTRLLQIVSDGAIKNKDITIKDLLIDSLTISSQSSIDELDGKKHNKCPSRIYYESLRGLSNYNNASYPLGVYPIYTVNNMDPLARYSGIPQHDDRPMIDIVIIHGISGSPFRTWRLSKLMDSKYSVEEPRDLCWYWLWPRELLAREYPNIRVIALEYYSQFLKGGLSNILLDHRRWIEGEWIEDYQRLESGDFMGFSDKFARKLRECGIGKNPYIILGHSFGGLITQMMLLNDVDMMNNLKGIIGYAVPYLGSSVRYINMLKLIGVDFSETVKKICDEGFMGKLLDDFTKLIRNRRFKIYTFEETVETKISKFGIVAFIVDRMRSRPPFTDYHYSPLNTSHNDVCKPNGIDDIRFIPIAEIIENIYNNK